MIRPLRRAHYRVWVLLAVLLPTLFLTALASRRDPTPRNASLHWEHYR